MSERHEHVDWKTHGVKVIPGDQLLALDQELANLRVQADSMRARLKALGNR